MELTHGLATAWKLARQNIGKAQKQQKECYDRQVKEPRYTVGGRVMVFMPHEKAGKKRSRHYHITGHSGLWRCFQMEFL